MFDFVKKNKKIFFAILPVFLIVVLFAPNIARAEWWSDMFLGGMKTLLYWIFVAVSYFLDLALKLLNIMTSNEVYNSVLFSDKSLGALNTGWKLVRDFINLFYILIIILVAISIILRVGKFNDKSMVGKIIGGAILVNFSKPITLAIIDVSQLAMNFFMDNIGGQGVTLSYSLAKNAGLAGAVKQNNGSGEVGVVVALIFAIVFTFIMACMILTVAVTFLIRMVALWVLIILSPIAFAGIALPGTPMQSMRTDWFQKITNWCFYGPILLFFLWLASSVMNSIDFSNSVFANLGKEITIEETATTIVSGMAGQIVPYIVTIYLLYYGWNASKKMAAAAGSSVGNLMNKGEAWMNKYGKMGLKGVGVGAALATPVGLAAGAGLVGWKASGAGDKLRAYKDAQKEKLAKNKNWGFLTKEGRKKKSEDIYERTKAKNTGKYDEYLRGKVNKQRKEWKDDGVPTDDKLRDLMANGKDEEKRAAALQLAESGKFRNADEFKRAVDAMGSDKILATKLRSDAEKKNLRAVLEYEIAYNGQARVNVYKEKLDKLKLKDLGEQDQSFHDSNDFRDYMRSQLGPGGRFTPGQLRTFAGKNLDANKTASWRGHGLI